jgi:hypothetical protein
MRGELLIRTDVEAAFEDDFNAWYDREHMAERAAIAGFLWSRRYVRLDPAEGGTAGPRYLALYQTMSLDVFRSAPYRAAFGQQTPWSVANFGRMRNTTRRVCAVSRFLAPGTGACIALIEGDAATAGAVIDRLAAQGAEAGLIGGRLLQPDPELSTPLPSETTGARPMTPFVVAEATTPAGLAALHRLVADLVPATAVAGYRLLWDLQARDLAAPSS